MWWVVDRVEGNQAVIVNDAGEEYVVRKGSLREGRVYWWNGRTLKRSVAEERRRAAAARAQLDRLGARDPGGDIIIR